MHDESRRALDQPASGIPRLLLAVTANDLQSHAKLNLLLATVFPGEHPNSFHVLGDCLGTVAPEQVNRAVLRRQFRGHRRATAEEQRWMRLLHRRRLYRLFDAVMLAG